MRASACSAMRWPPRVANIEKGELLSIMGPSGSGKTTLLHLLGCLDVPTSGTITIEGQETEKLGGAALARIRREKVGFVFQEFNLLPVLNAVENVELPLRYLKVKPAERRERAMANCAASRRQNEYERHAG